MKSIIQKEKRCFLCGCCTPTGFYDGLEDHHVFFGRGNRAKSEKLGLKVWLCGETCHRNGKRAAHRNRETDLFIKKGIPIIINNNLTMSSIIFDIT